MKRLPVLIAVLASLCHSSLADAKTHRDHRAIAAFKHDHPCPATGKSKGACKGYVIDYIKPLACSGADHPSNMQWQTTADAKVKVLQRGRRDYAPRAQAHLNQWQSRVVIADAGVRAPAGIYPDRL